MASLFNMPRPRGQKQGGLLDSGFEVGATDSLFQQMGRAPVDELFAGRNSAMIDDAKWDEREAEARNQLWGTREAILRDGDGLGLEGGDRDRVIRESVKDETGLNVYPGHGVEGRPEDSIFMYEFDDSGATLSEGWRDGGEMPTTLGGLLNHEELYQHYPELQNLPLSVEELGPRLMGSYGGIDPEHGLGKMSLNSSMEDGDIMDTILHETQHYIQRLENWPGGGGHNEQSRKNFAGWHPGRTEQWEGVARDNQDDLDAVRDQYGQEAYENISGEVLARDVEQRYNTRNNLNNVINQMTDPKSHVNSLPPDQYEDVLERAEYTSNALDYYPAHPRDAGNRYPHDMPEGNPMINPYVMRNTMEARHDEHGIQDDDTVASYWNADGLFEAAYKEMQRKDRAK